MKKKPKKQEQGVCPACGKKLENYTDTKYPGSNSIGYTWECACGAEGVEWYEMEFLEHEVQKI